jgi:uncharacterized protein (TIGR00159 family)
LTTLRWQNATDFLVLTIAFYGLIRWAREARALRIALGIAGLHAGALLVLHFGLVVTSWVLNGLALIAVVLLIVVFQPELRRTLMRLDSRLRLWTQSRPGLSSTCASMGEAVFSLARSHVGSLIVLVRKDSVTELTDDGIVIEAHISRELIESIFQKSSPLHDGALIIHGDRIIKANVVLPLTQRRDVPTTFGTRHRAAMGLAERSDAIILVVSEQRGEVRVMRARENRPVRDTAELLEILSSLERPAKTSLVGRSLRLLTSDLRVKFAAAGLAALVWSISFLAAATTFRIVSVPIEFSNVPRGMDVSGQSANRLQIELRGSPWVMDTSSLTELIARFDLSHAKEGLQTLQVQPDTVELPPGTVIDQVSPETVNVRVAPRH